ncbi:intermembrane lipid transfer protein Vps13D isoform X2 [Periplaneta americana]|uniref:intermembrane lipid transfer protein Vps13D isoform X2 n=1 Tax=Periplaneta americana TaxID=6978 RepID=UPI0037E989C0
MLERIVAWVLNNYLGKYVENLNTDQLSVALLHGEVELDNLPLKKDALRHFGIPIQVCAGYIGKVKLQIPVPQIRSAPWVIIIEQLCLVTGPVNLTEWDEEAEEQAAQDYKLTLLDAMEARWRAEMESSQASSYYATSYSSWLSLGTSLVANIIENLQLKIKDVHLRYEDNITVQGQAFALGVTIESLTAQSCDDKWMPRFVGWDNGDTSFKLMELTGFAVYWDKLSEDQFLGGLSLGELAVVMSQYLTLKHQFVLSPVSAQAHIKRNRSEQPLRSRTQPRIVCDLHLEEVPLSLTDWQYGQMVGCVKGLNVIQKCCRYRKWRPDVPISENPQAWWFYAAQCLVGGWRRSAPGGWETALQRARDNVKYVEMYSRILTCPTAAVPLDMKQLKDTMEMERGLEELRSLREVAMRKVRPPERDVIPTSSPPVKQGRGTLLQWFPQLWGWNYSTAEALPDPTDTPPGAGSTPSKTEMELEDQILDVLADTVENNTILRRDVVFGQFNFTLKQGTFHLCTTKQTEDEEETEKLPLMELQFENVNLGLESRPRSGSHKFYITLGAMFLRDHLTRDTAFPQLVGPHDHDCGSVLGRGGAAGRTYTQGLAKLLSQGSTTSKTQPEEPLFKLVYEYRPFNSSLDYRLHIQSRSLDVVYNPAAVKWLADFFTRPHQTPDAQLRRAARERYEVMKQKTKQEFIRNWEQILEGKLNDRKTWDVELDIWGPRIMFVEHFCDKNAIMVVVDFGKFHFSNQPDTGSAAPTTTQTRESDDEEEFQTPCSTPHGSEASISESQTLTMMSAPSKTDEFLGSSFTDLTLHQKLYDRYTMDLGDLQILVGRVRDNFKYAHQRGTSTLHVVDRFNISLQVERRVVFTTDPQFPSLTVSGNLPRLVVHVNEQKIDALRTMAAIISGKGLPSPFRSQQPSADENVADHMAGSDACNSADSQEWAGREMARLVMLQFSIDQMALEVQSRGRCVAELQVSGVRAAYTKRPYDTSISLSVHSLLLVDALQMFGPDFELLVASHKHVGMDSVSGSLRDSEPTSPTSPASPDPLGAKALKATSPIALTQALSSLQNDSSPSLRAVSPTNVIPSSPPYATSPPHIAAGRPPSINLEMLDTEALITVEIFLVSANCPSNEGSGEALQIASIQFNNLDIIANQETIVELMGFTRRVFPQLKPGPKRPPHAVPVHIDTGTASSQDEAYATPQEDMGTNGIPGQGGTITRTELTFDFHRLNILLLRAVMKENGLVGRKIGTATMTEAKVQATVGRDMVVQGSLGGLQVLDLTPEGQMHQRILSLGKDPLVERNIDIVSCLDAELYSMCQPPMVNSEESRAFSFSVRRPLGRIEPGIICSYCSEIKVRMASVWYTHSPHFVTELQSCATEFKQYLTNVARSIKSAATEMAMGLVHARTEALAQSLYMNSRLSSSLYGGSGWEMSPRRRRRSLSQSFEQLEGVSSTRGTTPHTPYSPSMDEDSLDMLLDVKLDIVLDTPVVVLPRSPESHQVFVAHLGKITASNRYMSSPDFQDREDLWGMSRRERYNVEIRDMNLYSLDTEKRSTRDTSNLHPVGDYPLVRAERLYSCADDGKPILHDTVIELVIDRDIGRSVMKQSDSLPTLLMGDDAGTDFQEIEKQDVVQISGSVVTPLKVSLSRQQYEQLLDTLNSLMAQSFHEGTVLLSSRRLVDIKEEEAELHTGVTTLNLDPALRARMLNVGSGKPKAENQHTLTLKVSFELPVFTVELRGDVGCGEQGLVDLSFRDFSVQYDKSHRFETHIQMSLRSLLMEDLSVEPESKHRRLVVSSAAAELEDKLLNRPPEYYSKSCPNLLNHQPINNHHGSLPDHLETETVFGTFGHTRRRKSVKPPMKRTKTVEYPCTPPPSPRISGSPSSMYREDNLVHINMVLVDKEAPNFISHYEGLDRSVNVDFNSLDIIVNVESWVVVLDFFGFGPDSPTTKQKTSTFRQSVTTDKSSTDKDAKSFNSELDIEIRSLTLVLNRPQYEVARANISHLSTQVRSHGHEQIIEGRLGSMSLLDLTPHGVLYKERFISSGHEALNFYMFRHRQKQPGVEVEYDSLLKLEMSSVLYVHTQRFVAEIQAFCHHFSQLQSVVNSIHSAAAGIVVPEERTRSTRLLLELHAGSPVILLPVSSQSPEILVVDLGKLSVNNSFCQAGAEGTISAMKKHPGSSKHSRDVAQSPEVPNVPCMLDVMQIELVNMDLYAGQREAQYSDQRPRNAKPRCALELGSFCVNKQGPSLLREKCQLKLQVERNLDTHLSHDVPDMSVKGTLSALHGALDLSQYKLIRGLLSYNIGETLDDFEYASSGSTATRLYKQPGVSEGVWTLTSIHLDLVDVILKLQLCHGIGSNSTESSLACINFIKSRLMVETYSNQSRDVDLVSQEILITDTRFQAEPVNRRSNVFTNILQPIHHLAGTELVQAEVHHRKRRDFSKFTILLNNMRLMAILDWWEAVRDFIMENIDNPYGASGNPINLSGISASAKPSPAAGWTTGGVKGRATLNTTEEIPYELKLNITDSEIVVVEDTSQWDTNAVILKSTTVVSYRPVLADKPLSCNLNHCEMFSCILGMEDETALSIIDPVTVNIEVTRRLSGITTKGIPDAVISSSDRVLEIQMQQQLNIRLSYHDMRMFIQMLNSLPKQTLWAKNHDPDRDRQPANVRNQIKKLSALGFHPDDCVAALEKCNGHLDDAALWLTQHADLADTAVRGKDYIEDNNSALSFHIVEVKATHICLCVIDDCRDSDVPLLELSLSQLALEQEIYGGGTARCILASDYYNRVLSGWEPFIEPWKCDVSWEHSLSTDLCRNRLQVHITAEDILNVNITNTLVELYKMVKENWTQDYYNLTPRERYDNGVKMIGSPPGYRRRSPFVPFAIRNDTGSRIWFTTLITTPDSIADPFPGKESTLVQDDFWTPVSPGETVPFSFEGRDKARHRDTHKLRIHQLGVRVEGWKAVGPVSVDKVGVYFRQASAEIQRVNLNLPQGRIVFEVTLEGSARKLVTVRSSLMLINQLQETVEVKLENTLIQPGVTGTKCIQVTPGGILPVPLSYVMSYLWVRPIDRSQPAGHGYVFCNKPITWSHVSRPGETVEELHMCISNRDQCFRFCAAIHRENFPYERITSAYKWVQPAHSVTLLSPITIVNLLPYDLHYAVKDAPSSSAGRMKPGESASLTQVDIEKVVELCFHLENFPRAGTLVVPAGATTYSSVVRLHDLQGRRLFLHGNVVCQRGAGVKVLVTAPFWIINKSGLPLVFRQEGVPTETAAGQFEEHEVARMVAPLLFSFADHEASPTVVARVGNGVHPEGIPQWCQHFHLHKGVQVRRLRVSLRDSRPDIMYVIGINVRPGRGRYRSTNIVTLSPRFQLHNKSTYQLQFAQRCFATTLNDPGAQATYLTAVPDCCLPFHWPRLDKEQLLCVRLLDVPNSLWSGGFLIDTNDSLHINVRDIHGKMHFLRVEVVLQGATYFIVFTDADTIPPTIRLDNYSEVPLQFHQSCVTSENLLSTVRPHSCVPYAWDEPTLPHSITLLAPGGALASYDMKSLGEDREAQGLTYENFIYIAFTGTFKACGGQELGVGNTSYNPLDVESQQLVLDVPEGNRVILSRKEKGARSQLWRMTGDGQLQHEGSSPPRDPRSKHSTQNDDRILVLDIAGPAPQPTQYVSLVLRRPDKRRKSTQTWHFTEDGRLCCAHNNMCVQAKDGFFGLHQGAATSGASWQLWSEAVLGPPQPVCHQLTHTGVPLEQAVSRQRLRPGSGFLAVKIITDGPTSVLHISDIKEKTYLVKDERDLTHVTMSRLPTVVHEGSARKNMPVDTRELQVKLDLPGGLGISLVSSQPSEELLFAHLTGINMEMVSTGSQQKLNLLVKDIQCDNQLFEAQCPVVVYVTPPSARSKDAESQRNLPTLRITTERIPSPNSNVATYKHFIVTVKNLSITIEERLLLKLFLFAGYSHLNPEQEDAEESDFEVQRILTEVTSVHAKKYYFGLLKLEPGHVKLSVMTSSKLPLQLQSIKRKLGLTLIKFEDASVDLKPFVKNHSFESSKFFLHSILKHYKDELKWQAAIILGSVDFLGSPLGFVNDVTEGVSGLLFEGNVQALVQNVTHGLSNSAAKVTESLSDGLGRVIMDEEHEETRQRIRKVHTGSSGDHIVAGLKGLGFGLLGGATSIFKQTYEGAYNEGFQGFISGFGKGLVGTVTKPVVGVLDLASEAASAVRDSSRSSSRVGPGRFRAPRCVTSPGGLLPHYTKQQSQGQEFLYSINKRNYSELFMAYECLRTGAEDLRILVSSEMVRVFSVGASGTCTIVVETHLSDLYHCLPTSRPNDEPRGSNSTDEPLHYIELKMRVDTVGLESIRRPLVRCDSEAVAKWVSQQVNYAKSMFEERRYTVISYGDNILED